MHDREQALTALKGANKVRLESVALCREMKRGDISVNYAAYDLRADSCRVWQFLRAIPKWGPDTASCAMRHLGVLDPCKKVSELTPRQRMLLSRIEIEVRGR